MINKNKVNKKGFTPLENKRSSILSSLTGFTLVEIIVAGLIITITAGGTFAAYLYARQFSDQFRHRAMAQRGAQEIIEYIRYRLADGYRNNVDLEPGFEYGLVADPTVPRRAVADTDLQDILNPADWNMNSFVDDLNISYDVSEVHFDDAGTEQAGAFAANPARNFKKITVRVTYHNRTVT
jgi:type II secretory pathway pseudopilin PulG